MKDFLIFLRYYFHVLRVVRHTLFALFALLVIGAAVISIAEGMNYGDALYLTLITGLTVGYGDIAPTTVVGRIMSVLIGLIGLLFFGIVIAAANWAIQKRVREKRSKEMSDDR